MGFLLQGVLQSLARLEYDALGSSNGDGLAGAGVDALTLSALTHLEGAEAGDGDLLTLGHSLAQCLECSIDSHLGALLAHLSVCRNLCDQIGLGNGLL